eukprot:scaffold653_cov345-Pavlova_lutheri.AAC.12
MHPRGFFQVGASVWDGPRPRPWWSCPTSRLRGPHGFHRHPEMVGWLGLYHPCVSGMGVLLPSWTPKLGGFIDASGTASRVPPVFWGPRCIPPLVRGIETHPGEDVGFYPA